MEQFLAALGIIIGIVICGFFASIGAKSNNGSKTKTSGTGLDGLPDSLRGNVEQVKDIRTDSARERAEIRKTRDTVDKSIDRLRDTLKLIKSTDNADGNLQDK